MDTVFQIDDYFELLALHRALLEAKFSPDPWDSHMHGNHHLANMANRVIETMMAMETEDKKLGLGGVMDWPKWRRVDNVKRPRVWEVCLQIIKKHEKHWSQLSYA